MTTVARHATGSVRRSILRGLVRRSAAGVFAFTRSVRAEIAAIAAAGQLGPDAETEIGRSTGART